MPSRADASPSFLYVPDLAGVGSSVTLSGAESHYLARVCRARPGDQATATDGRGAVARLRLLELGKRATARVETWERSAPARRAWVMSGAPEGARADWLVEKLAELGVERWQPLECARGGWRRSAARRERWERLAVAAMKQSQRRLLMAIEAPLGLEEALDRLPEGGERWLASTRGPRRGPTGGDGPSVAAVGPAGGFTAAEEAALEAARFVPICLSDGRLRSETAALAWALWWRQV